jgi:phosphoglycolate phosphatase
MAQFDAVIFDLDGTLLDSLADIADAANCVLKSMGKPVHPIDEFRFLVGDGVGMLFQRALPECVENLALRSHCMESFESEYESRWNNRSKPYEGIEESLNLIASAGVKMCVLSNKPDRFTKRCVSHFFPNHDFSVVLGHSEQFPRKPNPASAKWIGSELGNAVNRIAYVGDTNTDMKTAVAAGFFAMGVSWGFRTRDELVDSGARVVFDRPAELLAGLIGN